MSPPLTPDADEARRRLTQELSKPEYLNPQGWLQDLWNRLLDWLTGGAEIPVMNDAQATAVVVGFAILVVAAGAALWWRLGPVRAARRRRDEAFLADEDRSAVELRAEAARLAAADQWGQATLQCFRAMIRGLDERAIIEPNPGLTADEAASRASARLPQVAERLAAAAGVFDGLAYGGLPGSAGQYRTMLALDADVADLRPTLPGPVADAGAVEVEVFG